MYDFGETLKKYRNAKKMTLKWLGSKVGVSESTLSRYEKNEVYPSFETLRALSAVLGVSTDELCGTEARETASLYGLTEAQSTIVKTLIDVFRNYNDSFKKQISQEQYELLGKIVAEFSK